MSLSSSLTLFASAVVVFYSICKRRRRPPCSDRYRRRRPTSACVGRATDSVIGRSYLTLRFYSLPPTYCFHLANFCFSLCVFHCRAIHSKSRRSGITEEVGIIRQKLAGPNYTMEKARSWVKAQISPYQHIMRTFRLFGPRKMWHF